MSPESLPDAVRARVLAIASERLAVLAEELVPMSVRRLRHFTPAKRGRLGGASLAAALESDPTFRQGVAEGVEPALAEALRDGRALPAAPPEEIAAAAYLLRTDDWHEQVRRAADQLAARDERTAGAAQLDAVARLTEQLAAVRATGRQQLEQLHGELAAARAENTALDKRARQLGARAAAAERALLSERAEPAVGAAASAAVGAAAPTPERGSAELRRLRARLQASEAALASARAGARAERHEASVRLRVLLDALLGAAAGLRRELGLAPLDDRPADLVSGPWQQSAAASFPATQGRAGDDPALLAALLELPAVHLLVDGYNVTKTGYGEQPLEAQRVRLLAGLASLAARTGAETTVVFDGTAVEGVRVSVPRGVRLLFSHDGESADDVLRALAAAEPAGRPLVVVSSDRQVADDVRRDGARPVASRALLALLERGAGSVGPRT